MIIISVWVCSHLIASSFITETDFFLFFHPMSEYRFAKSIRTELQCKRWRKRPLYTRSTACLSCKNTNECARTLRIAVFLVLFSWLTLAGTSIKCRKTVREKSLMPLKWWMAANLFQHVAFFPSQAERRSGLQVSGTGNNTGARLGQYLAANACSLCHE